MKTTTTSIYIKLLFLGLLPFVLDSCALFRRKESSETTTTTKRPTSPSRPMVISSREVRKLIDVSRQYLGVPYRTGGIDSKGMDCSGLLFATFKEMGVNIPRRAVQQSGYGKEVKDLDQLRPGDLVFFVTDKGNVAEVNHSGMITEIRGPKEIYFIHASSSKGVREDNLISTYWMGCYATARRPF
ncbi:C40 family peptidase [Flectobacillus rivi]|uniref:C40 family peptidase n=1 Tax=Flectobacillus rivi TaxID=2984209 RepID=A0ABT6YW26_9BACT|nr:C40 family peptidase [Flectobacillus rivi]MDI9873078.1 C40 family peptidase [Flectobacillus rivi]